MSAGFDTLFAEVFKKDRDYIKPWLVRWDYQEKRKKQNKNYSGEKPSDFFAYNGPGDLVKWMNWFHPSYPDYLPADLVNPLIEESRIHDKKILDALQLNFDFTTYHKNIGLNNAHDFIFPRLYPVPERNAIKNILDFGAGYGRQANLWSTKIKDSIFLGMDAIPNSYTLQNLYYKSLAGAERVYDYVDNPSRFKILPEKKGIYHLPTWRYDLLPDNFFDLVICVQVLPELNSTLVKKMLGEFQRTLKSGGILYIRDHASIWKPSGKINVSSWLQENSFVLEFQPHIVLDKDLHGIPRIWRKIDPEVMASQKRNLEMIKKHFIEDMDALSGGLLKKLAKKIKVR